MLNLKATINHKIPKRFWKDLGLLRFLKNAIAYFYLILKKKEKFLENVDVTQYLLFNRKFRAFKGKKSGVKIVQEKN